MTLRYPGRYLCRCAVLLSLLTVDSSIAHANWTESPLTVRGTTAMIPRVSACNDGGLGTFVVWQEEELLEGPRVVRVQHVMPWGAVDPAWPAGGVIACAETADRPVVGVVADDLGGAYSWWLERTASEFPATYLLHLTRVVNGAIAPGWPARGRLLGEVFSQHVSLIPDGQHGMFAAWTSTLGEMLGIHLGPTNTGAGGWGDAARVLVSTVGMFEAWPQLAPAPDGGVFAGWASISADYGSPEGVFHLGRWTSAGAPSGVLASPITLGTFRSGFFWAEIGEISNYPGSDSPLIDVSEDARGGVFVLLAVSETPPSWNRIRPRLLRLQGDGTPTPGWPAGGPASNSVWWYPGGIDWAFRVFPDGLDGALAGSPDVFNHDTFFRVNSFSPSGSLAGGVNPRVERVDVALKNGPGVFTAHCHPSGANSQYDPPAHITVIEGSPPAFPTYWSEYYDERYEIRYGDVGIAATGDDGAVLFWSQCRERFGLFALRFGATTTDVAPAIATLAITSARFAPGRGLVAAVSLPDAVAGRLELFDLQGRRVASTDLPAAGAGSRMVELDVAARRGMYLARLTAGGAAMTRKVVQVSP